MIILLGGSGYVGRAFQRELERRGWKYLNLARGKADYSRFETLVSLLKEHRPEFVVNCAGYSGRPNVDACEDHRAETLLGNSLLPQTIAHACAAAGIPWGHVSSGCIYDGAKFVSPDGSVRIEKDLTRPEVWKRLMASPETVRGFTEEDSPNFCFREPPCSFYSGSKALGEEAIKGVGGSYLWRLRIPFDENDGPRNYLSKIQRYAKVYDNANSISHLGDFAWACLELWAKRAPFGNYNIINPGFVTTRQVVEMLSARLGLKREFNFFTSNEEFYRQSARTPRSNCILDVTKLLAAGVKLRPVMEALEDSFRQWKPEPAQG